MITFGEWCWGTSFYHNGSHYGFLFFRCPTSFYNRPSEIDIQSDEYYRTEFRLNAYKNAPAYIANLGTVKIELINSNYEGMFGSDLRIYTTVDTLEAATDVFESFCKAGDTEITQADFDDFYKYHALDDGDVRPVIGDISGYIMVKDGKYEIMLDASPDYFDQE